MRHLAVLAFVVATACSPTPPDMTPGTPAFDLTYTGDSLARMEGSCDDGPDRRCVEVDLTWPVFSGAPEVAVTSMNRFVQGHITAAVTLGDTDFDAPEPAAEDFVSSYLEFIAEEPDSAQSWMVSCHGDVVHQSAATVTIRLDTETYTGGAHGLQWTTLASFDATTGQRLVLDDLVSDAGAVTAIAEQFFREGHGLEPEESLDEAGFWFTDDVFSLPEDVALTADGLMIYWPPYEIAPYAMGSTELVLHSTDLGDLLIRE
jgi:hypothetical protein